MAVREHVALGCEVACERGLHGRVRVKGLVAVGGDAPLLIEVPKDGDGPAGAMLGGTESGVAP